MHSSVPHPEIIQELSTEECCGKGEPYRVRISFWGCEGWFLTQASLALHPGESFIQPRPESEMYARTFKAGCLMFLMEGLLGSGEQAGEGWGGRE